MQFGSHRTRESGRRAITLDIVCDALRKALLDIQFALADFARGEVLLERNALVDFDLTVGIGAKTVSRCVMFHGVHPALRPSVRACGCEPSQAATSPFQSEPRLRS